MAFKKIDYARPVYIIDGCRTPFLKARGKPGPFKHADLAINASRALLDKMPFEPDAFDEVIFGSAMPGSDEANISRIVALRLGCGDKVPAYTVHRNCGYHGGGNHFRQHTHFYRLEHIPAGKVDCGGAFE